MNFIFPKPRRTFDLSMRDGAIIRVRQHGNPKAQRIALCHGNGLASDAYYPFWRLLEPDFELVIFDVRNHGQNPAHGASGHHWANFASDQQEICAGIDAALGRKPTIAAFHSLSSIAALRLAVDGRAPWSALALFDPPICPPANHPLHQAHVDDMAIMNRRARRRPQRYRSRELFEFQLRTGRGFKGWVDGAHRLFAQATLRYDETSDDWILACPRELEASVFATCNDADIWPRIGDIAMPLRLLGADPELAGASQPAANCQALAGEFGLDYDCLEGTSHFLQIEQPERCAEILRAFTVEQALVT